MELIDKATILADVWLNAEGVEDLLALIEDYDLGFPYAFGIVNGHIRELSEEGEQQVLEAWDALCNSMDIDETANYLDFEHMVLAADQS